MNRKSPENPIFAQSTAMKPKNFIITGAAGYVAQKHLKAIKANGGKVIAAIDPNDNLEILDEYFPGSEYFKSIESAQNFINQHPVDCITICSPSFLHAQHIRFALENQCNAICESPLVLSVKEYEEVKQLEEKTGHKVFNLLQYRYSKAFVELKKNFVPGNNVRIQFINHSYRGKWFKQSWKGNPEKSGGLQTILGYHFFDAFIWIYGKPLNMNIRKKTETHMTGELTLENARVTFELNIHPETEPIKQKLEIILNGKQIPLMETDDDLFKKCYHDIISGKGYTTGDVAKTIHLLAKPEQ
jgi:UDP-N-acetyl-2-amino-2-deoxyglucuronate dehydrogenase